MAIFERTVPGDALIVASRVAREIESSALSAELVEQSEWSDGGVQVYVRVFEKYYMRNNSRASLTLVVTGSKGSSHVIF